MEQFVALAAAAAARCAEEEAGALSSALQGTAPSPAGASASSRALAREEWLRRRESHLEDARRAQQLQKEREVAQYFSPEINKVRAQRAPAGLRPRASLALTAPPTHTHTRRRGSRAP